MTTPNADYASVSVEAHIAVKVWADGRVEIPTCNLHVLPARLTRRLTKAEMKANGVDDEWWEGGVAILSPRHAANGADLCVAAEHAAHGLREAILRAAQSAT